MATSFVGESEQLTIDALLSHVANVTKHLREELHQLRLNLPNLIQEVLKQMYDGDSLQRKPIPQVVEKDVEILHRQDDGRSQGGVQEGTLLHEIQKELQRLNERIQLLEVQIRKDSALSQNGSGKLFCSRNAREAYMIEKDHNAHELRRVSEEVKSLYSVHKEAFTTLEQLLHSRIEAGLAHFADRNDDLLRQMNNRLSDSHRDMNTKMEQEIRSLRENILSQVMYDREENKKRLNRACDHIRTDVETFKRQSREDLLHLRNDFEARLNRSTSYGIKGGIGMTFGSSEAEMSQNSNYGGFQRETATWKSNWETRDPFT